MKGRKIHSKDQVHESEVYVKRNEVYHISEITIVKIYRGN